MEGDLRYVIMPSLCVQLFLAQGKDILINSADCVEEGVLGQGAYATVFQVKIKRPGEVSSYKVIPTHHSDGFSLNCRLNLVDHMPSRLSLKSGAGNLHPTPLLLLRPHLRNLRRVIQSC